MTLFDVDEPASESAVDVAVSGPTVRVRMTVAYDGADFHGFAPNAGVETVGGTLQERFGRVLGRPVTITCAGRTDAGVHAWGQVISFDAPADRVDLDELVRVVNRTSGGAIAVRDAALVDDGFDARFSARSRCYRYTIVNRPDPDPFLRRTAWHVAAPLDLRVLRLACDPLIGLHDFSSFCRAPQPRRDAGPDDTAATLERRVLDARWTALDDEVAGSAGLLRFEIEATAFCHQMVRSIVGTLVEVGSGRRTPADVGAALRARDRSAAGQLAPPQGLCLWRVRY